MKRPPLNRIVFLAVAALLVILLATRDRWEDPVLAALGVASAKPHYLGYVEGETTLVAPPVAGRLVERPVNRGDRIARGQRLFVIDTTQATAEVARAEGALGEARARHENLLTGKRPEELEVTRAQRREVEAALVLAEQDLKRQSELVERGIATRQAFDQATSQVRQLRARAASLSAQERANELAGRHSEIVAAAALVEQGQASLDQARKRRDDLAPSAPEDALVENTFFNVGEWVGGGTPVVSLLPPSRVKLRFFVPEDDVAQARKGRPVAFSCDGCPSGLEATISYVAPRAEFTPPVIYSQSARSKLVFLIEARPDPTAAALSPGLPVTVEAFKP